MLHIIASDVNHAYAEAMWKIRVPGMAEETDSRNGKVLRFISPVVTTYKYPTRRMLFDPVRDANPFFHIFEGIWMLAGRNDVKWISQFNSNIGQFSDDGKTFNGAYGFRWRNHWDTDQLSWVIYHLKRNPGSRRAVISMWDPDVDPEAINNGTKDVPCNTGIYFAMREGRLEMTVTNRSNDMVWGCYGANAVHMSMLQEFVANALGVPVGRYNQFSHDLHVYEQHWGMTGRPPDHERYTDVMAASHIPLTTPDRWVRDLDMFETWTEGLYPYEDGDSYLQRVLRPMLRSYTFYKSKDREESEHWARAIPDKAVSVACLGWLSRRNWEKA